ncbi:SOD2 [Mytilus edulis]|uniref:SOD2 n=1 Tax=Mytilus edulis TaxID=6550 RepID=A0A8S3QC71_MYTED|nr:SOD2 [Mytilus edulis]
MEDTKLLLRFLNTTILEIENVHSVWEDASHNLLNVRKNMIKARVLTERIITEYKIILNILQTVFYIDYQNPRPAYTSYFVWFEIIYCSSKTHCCAQDEKAEVEKTFHSIEIQTSDLEDSDYAETATECQSRPNIEKLQRISNKQLEMPLKEIETVEKQGCAENTYHSEVV